MEGSLEHVLTASRRLRPLIPRDIRVKERFVTSLEALLATNDAPQLFFEFLWYDGDQDGELSDDELSESSDDNESESDDDDESESEYRYDDRDRTNILWLSENCCISCCHTLHHFDEQLDPLFELRMYTDELDGIQSYVYRNSSRAPLFASLTNEVDTILLLLSEHKETQKIRLVDGDHFTAEQPFPVSLQALETFVTCREPRTLDFGRFALSTEQWRVIAFHCSDNLTLVFGDRPDWEGGLDSLTQVMLLNQGPTKMELLDCRLVEVLAGPNFRPFVAALEATTSLVELTFHDRLWLNTFEYPSLTMLLGAVSRNRGLRKLDLVGLGLLSQYDWDLFWASFASHPTLKTLLLPSLQSPSEASDQLLIRSVCRSNNTVLCEINFDQCVYNRHVIQEQIRPVLELNRFRPVVEAIKQERDIALRERLFATTLLSDQVSQHDPAFRYFLLKEIPDLLVRFSSLDDVLLQQGNQAKRMRHSS